MEQKKLPRLPNRAPVMEARYTAKQMRKYALKAIAESAKSVGEAYLCDRCQTPFDGAWDCPNCGYNVATKNPIYIKGKTE